jgi:hypothetical protein
MPVLAEDDARVGTTLTGEHYEIRLDFEDEALARELLPLVEAAFGETVRFLRRDDPKVDAPLVINVYETVAAFEEVEQQLTKGRFARNQFFSHFDTRAVYGALTPDGSPSVRATLGTSQHFKRQIAHEAMHVAVYALIANHRDHPDWLGEGMATLIAERVSKARGWTKDPGQTPFYAKRMVRCRSLRARGLLPGPRAIFQENLGHLPWLERYAVWWSFFRFLDSEYPSELRKIVDGAVALGGGSGFTRRLYAGVRGVFDDAALDAVNDAYRRSVDAMAPIWDEVYRSLETDGETWRQLAYSTSNAVAWRLPAVGSTYTIAGRVSVPASDSPQANVLLGERDAGFFSVAIRVGSGVTLLECQGNRWENHWHADREIEAGAPVDFRVEVSGREIVVRIDGREVGRHTAGRDLAGRWGVGVQARGGARWEGVGLRR